jgi:hypothetical protein
MTNFIIPAEGVVIEDTHKEVGVGRSYRESELLVPFGVGELIFKIKPKYINQIRRCSKET